MTSESLLLSILAMDAYNRGYGAGLADQQSADPDGLGLSGFVGPATILALPEGIDVNGWQAANFYAIAYTIGGGVEGIAPGATVISYRGTDNIGADIWSGWTIGAGWIGSGTQADEALAFYTAVTGRDWWEADNNAILTGHSLGGGLAGFVSWLSGTPGHGFDHMPFGIAAAFQSLYVPDLPETQDYETSRSSFVAEHVSGEVLSGARNGLVQFDLGLVLGLLGLPAGIVEAAATRYYESFIPSNLEIDPHANIFELHNLQRHSQALLVTLKYAQQETHASWIPVADLIWGAAFDDEIGKAAGFAPAQSFGTGSESAKLLTAIAYSALDGDTGLVFGNTGIRAMFDDADELGDAFNRGAGGLFYQAPLSVIADDLAKSLVRFAGSMANRKVKYGDFEEERPERGILTQLDSGIPVASGGNTLRVDFSERTWDIASGEQPALFNDGPSNEQIVGKLLRMFNLTQQDEPGSFTDRFVYNKQANPDQFTAVWIDRFGDGGGLATSPYVNLERLELAFGEGSVNTVIAEPDGSAGDGAGTRKAWLNVGGDGPDSVYGNSLANVVLGGFGEDVVRGGDGDDILAGNQDDDNLYGDAGDDYIIPGQGDSDYVNGGEGHDIVSLVDYSGPEIIDLEYVDPDGNDSLLLFGDVIEDIEEIHGTSFDDRIYSDRSEDGYTLPGDKALTLNGGDGDDYILGGLGVDYLYGGNGDDELVTVEKFANVENHQYLQDKNGDIIDGGGEDYLNGGHGFDRYIINSFAYVYLTANLQFRDLEVATTTIIEDASEGEDGLKKGKIIWNGQEIDEVGDTRSDDPFDYFNDQYVSAKMVGDDLHIRLPILQSIIGGPADGSSQATHDYDLLKNYYLSTFRITDTDSEPWTEEDIPEEFRDLEIATIVIRDYQEGDLGFYFNGGLPPAPGGSAPNAPPPATALNRQSNTGFVAPPPTVFSPEDPYGIGYDNLDGTAVFNAVLEDVSFEFDGRDLWIRIADSEHRPFNIRGRFSDGAYIRPAATTLHTLEFLDGSVTIADLQIELAADILALSGTMGNDTLGGRDHIDDYLYGLGGLDTYIYGPNSGSDIILRNALTATKDDGVDVIQFEYLSTHVFRPYVASPETSEFDEVLYFINDVDVEGGYVERYISQDTLTLKDYQVSFGAETNFFQARYDYIFIDTSYTGSDNWKEIPYLNTYDAPVAFSNAIFSRGDGDDLVISDGLQDWIIRDQFTFLPEDFRETFEDVDLVVFSDGRLLDRSELAGLVPLILTDENPSGSGSNFGETVHGNDSENYINAFDGDDTVFGLGGADLVIGGYGNDFIEAGAGYDTIEGGPGADFLDGGSEGAIAVYENSPTGVTIRFDAGLFSGGEADGDVLININDIRGSTYVDVLVGNAESNIFFSLDGDDQLFGGDGNDFLAGGAGADTLDGGAGDGDVAEYKESPAGVNVNLTTGVALGGDAQGDALIEIEALRGSSFSDMLTGDSNDNRLTGREGDDTLVGVSGNDVLIGGPGADYLDGGDGSDAADYSEASSGVTVLLNSGVGTVGDAAGDTYTSIEKIYGSAYADMLSGDGQANRLIGNDGNDKLSGFDGNDYLFGGEGADSFDGGAGMDTASYDSATGGVGVNLLAGGFAGEADGDTFGAIENVVGSPYDDTIIGDIATNGLHGGEGDDTLQGAGGSDQLYGGEGADLLDGGDGIDTANYSGASDGVGVDLATSGFAGEATGDQYVSIEFVLGTIHNDTLLGDNLNNRLTAGLGADTVDGRGGNDVIVGGMGNDRLTGGSGFDVFWFRDPAEDNDIITDFEAGNGMTDRLWLGGFTGLTDFGAVLLNTSDTTQGAVISMANGSITLANVFVTDLAPDDFIFS